jgi:hypothetical protein
MGNKYGLNSEVSKQHYVAHCVSFMKPIHILLATLALTFQPVALAKFNCAEQAKSFALMISIEQFFRKNIDYSEINRKRLSPWRS